MNIIIFINNFISSSEMVYFSQGLIAISLIILFLSLIIHFFKREPVDERKAFKIANLVRDIKKGKKSKHEKSKHNKDGKSKDKSKDIKNNENNLIKDNEGSLKEMLVKKFKPKIEEQLKTEVSVVDFNAQKENFIAKINVQGNEIELVLDSTGKIIDYKK